MKERTKLGRNIESVMLAAHYTQDALGQEIGVSQSTMSRLLTSNVERERDFHYVEKIAKATQAPIHLLVAGTELATKVPAPVVVTLDPESRIKWLVYFASALTGLNDVQRKRIDTDAAVVRQACEEIQGLLYEPAWYTDPNANKDLSPSQVYAIDHQQVSQSHFMIFDCRYPSFGAGQELEIAAAAGLPVILLSPHDARVSRMVRGTYARTVEPVTFGNDAELLSGLRGALTAVVADASMIKDARQRVRDIVLGAEPNDGFPARVKQARMRMGPIDEYTVARLVGISPEAVLQIERGQYSNPSLTIVRRLAAVLKTSVSMLVDGVSARWEDIDPTMRKSLDFLLELGEDERLTQSEVQMHWQSYVAEVTPTRLAVAERRLTPLTKANWRDRVNKPAAARTGKLFDV